MTLVIARQKGSTIAIVSDTGVMEHGVKLGAKHHIPKICIVTPDLAVAFAGSPDLAKRYLDEFPSELSASFRPTVNYFLDRHRESDGAVDFLVCFNRPAKIIPIKDRRQCMATRHTWIGDYTAFEAFQRYHNQPQARASVTPFYEAPQISTTRQSESRRDNETFSLLGTLRYVILDPKIEAVFGSEVAVNNVDGQFQYRSYTFILEEQPISLLLPQSLIMSMSGERAEMQNFASICFVAPAGSSIQAIAYHHVRGKLTYLYWGQAGKVLSNASVIIGKNLEEFMQLTRAEFGIEWIGGLSLRAPPPQIMAFPQTAGRRV